MAFAPDYATSGRFYVYLTAAAARGRRRDPGPRVPALGGEPRRRRPGHRRGCCSRSAHDRGRQPQRRPAAVRAGRQAVARHGRRWRRQQPVRPRAGPGVAARQADPARPGGAGAGDRVASGCATRGASRSTVPTGQLVIGDVGQDAWEEIDVGLAANYGWACLEGHACGPAPGAACASGAAAPVLEQTHSGDGYCSITGGYVVRDPGLPTLLGPLPLRRLLQGRAALVRPRQPGDATRRSGSRWPSPSSFGEDSCGRLLVVSLAGPVYRLVDGALSACASTAPPADRRAAGRRAAVLGRGAGDGLRSVRRLQRLSIALRVDEACSATVSGRDQGRGVVPDGARVGGRRVADRRCGCG